jgi:LDH2 family malate/lactate/ureidoglycolate dehydrogenase
MMRVAMQKVVGSNPIIRSKTSCRGVSVLSSENGSHSSATGYWRQQVMEQALVEDASSRSTAVPLSCSVAGIVLGVATLVAIVG